MVVDRRVLQIELEVDEAPNSATGREQTTGPDQRRINSIRASFTDFL